MVPGAIPPATAPDARAAWETMCTASLVPGTRAEPVRAFELGVDVRYRGTARGSNDIKAEFRFLAPAFVRVKIVEGNREVGRGPGGDWLDDGARKERIRLTVGRQYAEDRRQLDQWQAIAKDFVALTDPKSLRIAKLEALPAAPASLPETVAKRGGELRWVRVSSPDFRLVDVPPDRLFRASLGRDPKSGWVELALIEEDVQSSRLAAERDAARAQGCRRRSKASWSRRTSSCTRWESGRAIPAFAATAGMDLFLHIPGSTLRAKLAPADFDLR
jgi:hypothetical protein